MKTHYIYAYRNLINNNIYVGKTEDLERRKKQHSRSKSPLGEAIREYGIANFLIWIIDMANSDEEANIREKVWIAFVRDLFGRENVYNKASGGSSGNLGEKLSDETRRKISEVNKGKKLSDETKMKISEANKGRKHGPRSDETKMKIGEAHKGKKLSDETKMKMRKPKSDEHKRKMSESAKARPSNRLGKHHSDETRLKMSESKKGRAKKT